MVELIAGNSIISIALGLALGSRWYWKVLITLGLLLTLTAFCAYGEEAELGPYGRYYYTKDGKQMMMFDYITDEGKEYYKKEGLRPATQDEIGKFWERVNNVGAE